MNQETSYRVLGVNSYSTFPEIKKKYRELIKIKHPDHGGNSDAFILVQEAYKFLEKNHNKFKSAPNLHFTGEPIPPEPNKPPPSPGPPKPQPKGKISIQGYLYVDGERQNTVYIPKGVHKQYDMVELFLGKEGMLYIQKGMQLPMRFALRDGSFVIVAEIEGQRIDENY